MRFPWIKPSADTTATGSAATHLQAASLPLAGTRFVVRDFVKLVAYAVVSGVAFSALAIGVTLAVSRDSEAQTSVARWVAKDGVFILAEEVPVSTVGEVVVDGIQHVVASETGSDLSPTAGSLYIGDGCGAEEVSAMERDWFVSIDKGIATVQVMQTFLLPEQIERMGPSESEATLDDEIRDAEGSAPLFSALLPSGAEFWDLRLDFSSGRLFGKTSALNRGDEQDYQSVMRTKREAQARGELPVYLTQAGSGSSLRSAQVFDLCAGGTVVVTYRYRIAIDQDNGRWPLAR
ncbi:MAG: hypothetical protein ING75_15590 [Rhodocyclaceae bacterium]|nr:hypothetical protein [Rhodocyclaceae bacterium]